MKKHFNLASIAVFLILLLVFNASSTVHRREITNLELVHIIGMDTGKEQPENISCTILRNTVTGSDGSSGSGDSEGNASTNQKILTVEAPSYDRAFRMAQTYTDKQFSGTHIGFFLLGEEAAQQDIRKHLDYVLRNNEIRLNSKPFIIRGMTADEFLRQTAKGNYDLNEVLRSTDANNMHLGFTGTTLLVDAMRMLSEEPYITVLPAVQLTSFGEMDKGGEESGGKEPSNVLLNGYGVVKEGRLVGYLENETARAYNIVSNRLTTTNLDIPLENGGHVSFGVTECKSRMEFQMEGDEIRRVVIRVEARSNFDEVMAGGEGVFREEDIRLLEEEQEKKLAEQLEVLIGESKRLRADILGVCGEFRLQHPYLFRGRESGWNDRIAELEIVPQVQVRIQRTLDMVGTNN